MIWRLQYTTPSKGMSMSMNSVEFHFPVSSNLPSEPENDVYPLLTSPQKEYSKGCHGLFQHYRIIVRRDRIPRLGVFAKGFLSGTIKSVSTLAWSPSHHTHYKNQTAHWRRTDEVPVLGRKHTPQAYVLKEQLWTESIVSITTSFSDNRRFNRIKETTTDTSLR